MGDLSLCNGFTAEEIDSARVWAERYQSRGWQVLPSARDRKKPLVTYANHWKGGLPDVASLWRTHPSGNLQVMAGSCHNLCVVDCDGPGGLAEFSRMLREHGQALRTWVSSSDELSGLHYWFRLPPRQIGRPIPKRLLWGVYDPESNGGKGGWKSRCAIELLCDRSLVMAPPSIHPTTGRRYQFHRGRSPLDLAHPAVIPSWILAMPDMRDATLRPKAPGTIVPPNSPSYQRSGLLLLPCKPTKVLQAIPDLCDVAADRYGLRFVSRTPNSSGWVRCHAIDREDRNPSAAFFPASGRYWESTLNGGISICFFRLGVECGVYPTWRDACLDLARQYLPHLFDRSGKHVVRI